MTCQKFVLFFLDIFMNCLQVEEEDLEEFEMLEHFADNASFSSNSSLVVKVLQKDRWKAAQLQVSCLFFFFFLFPLLSGDMFFSRIQTSVAGY